MYFILSILVLKYVDWIYILVLDLQVMLL